MSLVSGLLNHEITSISSTAKDRYGDTTPTVVYENVKCRWQEIIAKDVSTNAIVKDYNAEIWLLPNYTIEEDYEIVYSSKTYKVVSVSPKYDLSGNADHMKVLVK